MITAVLGAPGSGKSTAARLLPDLLPGHVVLDWDALMDPAAALAGREIRHSPATWPAYRGLIRAVLDAVAHLPVVLPAELSGWPAAAWLVLDCTDEERRRLAPRGDPGTTEAAIRDARVYRSLGLPVIDTTGTTPEAAAQPTVPRTAVRAGGRNDR